MSEDASPTPEADAAPARRIPSWPWLTMALNLALIATVFVTRERWGAWKLVKTIDGCPVCSDLRVRADGKRAVGWNGLDTDFGPWIVDLESGADLWWKRARSTHQVAEDVSSVIVREHVAYRSGTPRDKPKPLSVLDVEAGVEIYRLSVRDLQARSAWFAAGGKLIVAEHEDGVTRVWDAFKGELVQCAPEGLAPDDARRPPGPFAWHAAGDPPGVVRIAGEGMKPRTVTLDVPYPMARWHIDQARALGGGSRILAWEYDGWGVGIWDGRTGQLLAEFTGRACDVVGERLWIADVHSGALLEYRRIRPEWWWGVFWLPHLWVIVALSVALVASGWRDVRRMRRREREAAWRDGDVSSPRGVATPCG